jgi:hypothetical protein
MKDALNPCLQKGNPSAPGFVAALLSNFCNPEKVTRPNPAVLCAGGPGPGQVMCAAPPDLEHDPVLRVLSAAGGDPEATVDSLLGRSAAKAEERQTAKEEILPTPVVQSQKAPEHRK